MGVVATICAGGEEGLLSLLQVEIAAREIAAAAGADAQAFQSRIFVSSFVILSILAASAASVALATE